MKNGGVARFVMISLLLSGMSGRKWVAAAVGGRAVSNRSAGHGRRRSGELKKKKKKKMFARFWNVSKKQFMDNVTLLARFRRFQRDNCGNCHVFGSVLGGFKETIGGFVSHVESI